MTQSKAAQWGLRALALAILMTLLLLWILYPAQARRKPELLEMSVVAREPDGSAWATARQGMEQAAADLQVELRFLFPVQSNSVQEQRQLLQRELEAGASAILLFPADRSVLTEPVPPQTALVTLETALEGTAACVGVDNQALGEALAAASLNGAGPGETVLLLDSAPPESGVGDRLTAAESLLLAEQRQVRRFSGSTGALAEALADRDVRAVIAFEASSLEQASSAVSALESPPALYGPGSTAVIAAGLEQGNITAVLAQNAFSSGYLAVETAAKLARGETVQPPEALPFFTVRQENMYDSEYQKLLFPVTW